MQALLQQFFDFAIMARREGKPAEEAIFEGCLQRFRPIMMTTMCALLGTMPIALGYGAGGEARRPLGLTVVGGSPVFSPAPPFLDLPSSGGLYQSAVVTYRGDEIGRVTGIDVTKGGVRAELTLKTSVTVPAW